MNDLDRIAAAVRHVARDSELMLDPRRWGVEQIQEFLQHIESTAKPDGSLPSYISPRDIVIGPAGDYQNYISRPGYNSSNWQP